MFVNVVLREPVMQTAYLEKDRNSFTVCVAIGMFVLGVWGITLPSFFFLPGTGLLRDVSLLIEECVIIIYILYPPVYWSILESGCLSVTPFVRKMSSKPLNCIMCMQPNLIIQKHAMLIKSGMCYDC